MRKFMDSPSTVPQDYLHGLALAHPDLLVDTELKVVSRAGGPRRGKVGIVSGGGSGHEPLHAGFVGRGMLDAAACGDMFTSPVPDQVIAATRAADGGAGIVHIVKNYTGDVMNFELAEEVLEDAGETRISTIVVDDDIAVEDSTFTAGRRGTGLAVLIEKLVGAAAEYGVDLDTLTEAAGRLNAQGRSMGVALSACTVPEVGVPTFDLAEGLMEVGVGIHGEPGSSRREAAPASEIAALLADSVLTDLPFARGQEVIALVSGLGGTPLIEQYLMYGLIADVLADRGVRVARSLVGPYVTSLDMAGIVLTLLRVEDRVVELWDAPVDTPALRWGC